MPRRVLLNTDLAGSGGKEGLAPSLEVAHGATVPKHYSPWPRVGILAGRLADPRGRGLARHDVGEITETPPPTFRPARRAGGAVGKGGTHWTHDRFHAGIYCCKGARR
jgi:hypothetical protein